MEAKRSLIPDIEDSRLERLRRKIVPLMRYYELAGGVRVSNFTAKRDGEDRALYRLRPNGLSPKETFGTRRPAELATGLKEIGRAPFLSTFQSFFWPSEAEVLAQMPPHFEDSAVAYEVSLEHDALHHQGLDTYFRATAIFYAAD